MASTYMAQAEYTDWTYSRMHSCACEGQERTLRRAAPSQPGQPRSQIELAAVQEAAGIHEETFDGTRFPSIKQAKQVL